MNRIDLYFMESDGKRELVKENVGADIQDILNIITEDLKKRAPMYSTEPKHITYCQPGDGVWLTIDFGSHNQFYIAV